MSGYSELFRKLVSAYAQLEIAYPQLKPVTVAQWALESGRGTSLLATKHFNFGGLKWRPEMQGYATPVWYKPTHEDGEEYCKFASLGDFIKGYWRFIGRAYYAGWEEHAETGEGFIRFIGPIYCPTQGYVDRVLALLDEAQELLKSFSSGVSGTAGEGGTTIPPSPGAFTVVIDPGHGGSAKVGGSSPNNAVSPSGVKEKGMTLKLALYARDALIKRGRERQLDIKVFLTRDRDVNVGIADRAKLAAQKKAQLFLSIHFNGGLGCNRVETFYRVKEKNKNYQEDKKLSYKIQRAVFDIIHGYLPKTKQDSADHGIKPDTQTEVKSLGVLRDEYLGPGCRSCLVEIAAIDIQEVDQLFNHSPEGDQVFLKVAEALAQAMVDDLLEQG